MSVSAGFIRGLKKFPSKRIEFRISLQCSLFMLHIISISVKHKQLFLGIRTSRIHRVSPLVHRLTLRSLNGEVLWNGNMTSSSLFANRFFPNQNIGLKNSLEFTANIEPDSCEERPTINTWFL